MKKWVLGIIVLILVACGEHTTPREYGYFRIDLPEHSYHTASLAHYPYSFLLSDYAQIEPVNRENEIYWIDIHYPQWKAVIHCSYKPVNHNLRQLSDDAQEFVFSHACKASAIPEQEYVDDGNRIYALRFDLEGNTATPTQFYLTDSTHNFFRGALYFNVIPNQDSLAPVADYIRADIMTLIESFRWNNER